MTGCYALKDQFRLNPQYRDHPTIHQTFLRAGYQMATYGKIYHMLSKQDAKDANVSHRGGDGTFFKK